MVDLTKTRATLLSALPPAQRHPERSKPRLTRLAQSKDPDVVYSGKEFLTFLPNSSNLEPRTANLGFTLFELLIVMMIIAILAAMAVPMYTRNVVAAKEAVLKEDLQIMRTAIGSYTVDKQKAPQALDDLVTSGYLKAIPKDPFTGRTDTWVTTQSDTLASVDQTDPGIDDVHSGAQMTGNDGTSYNTW